MLCLLALLLLSPVASATTVVPTVPEPVAEPVPAAPPTVTATAPAATPVAAKAAEEDKMVCERVKELGSTRLKRVCKTMSQREREREAARDASSRRSIER